MATSHDRGSAEIYQFPARGRFAAANRDRSDSVPGTATPQLATTAFGGNWYHEEAIREAERARGR